MTTREPRGGRTGLGPVQDPDRPANGGMPDHQAREEGATLPKNPAVPGRRRTGTSPVGGFSAEALPLRPAAERSADLEREERLRLMATRRRLWLPAVRPRPRAVGWAIMATLAVVVAFGLTTVILRGGGAPGYPGAGDDRAVARQPAARPRVHHPLSRDSPPGGHPLVVQGAAVAPSRGRRARRRPPERRGSGQGGRRQRSRAPRPAHEPSTTMAPAAVEEPVATPTAETAPGPSSAPEPTPAVEPAPEPDPPPPASTTKDEPAEAHGPSTVERQFGFEE